MGKTTKSKDEYTIDETIKRFSKLKVVLSIIENKILTEYNKEMLKEFFIMFPYAKCSDQICKNLAYFIKHDLNDFYIRFKKLREVSKNSREWHIIQMDEIGKEIFLKKYVNNPHIKEKTPGYGTSKSALLFFKEINIILNELNIICRPLYSDKSNNFHEFRIRDCNNKWFSYDYTIKEIKIIIEYNGEHCHPNKEMSEESWNSWKHIYTKESANITFERDLYKQKLAEEKGFKYIIVWHSEDKISKLERIKNNIKGIEVLPYIPKTKRIYILTTPDGKEIKDTNTLKFKKEYNISNDRACALVTGKIESYNGYKLRKIYELI